MDLGGIPQAVAPGRGTAERGRAEVVPLRADSPEGQANTLIVNFSRSRRPARLGAPEFSTMTKKANDAAVMSAKEVAAYLRICKQIVYRLIRLGRLRAFRIVAGPRNRR